MKDAVRGTFWPYDVFGYLLPGLVLLAVAARANEFAGRLYSSYWHDGKWTHVVVVVGMAYVAGHVIAAFSSWILERGLLRKRMGWPTERMFPESTERTWGRSRVLNFFVPEYGRPYSAAFRADVARLFRERTGGDVAEFHDRFWLAWNYVGLHAPVAHRRATHFLELYGFSRNLAMSALMAAAVPVVYGWTAPVPWWAWSPGWLVVAVVMFCNYAKLLRRLNDEVFRAFVALAMGPPAPPPTPDV